MKKDFIKRIFFSRVVSPVTKVLIVSIVVMVSVFTLNRPVDVYGNFDNESKKLFLENNHVLVYHRAFNTEGYLISKDTGWSIYKEYFKKGTLLVDISNCKVLR